MGRHLRSEHGMVPADYMVKWNDARLICDSESTRIGISNGSMMVPVKYVKRWVYRLPDGSLAGKKDKWLRAWEGNPPADSKISTEINIQLEES